MTRLSASARVLAFAQATDLFERAMAARPQPDFHDRGGWQEVSNAAPSHPTAAVALRTRPVISHRAQSGVPQGGVHLGEERVVAREDRRGIARPERS